MDGQVCLLGEDPGVVVVRVLVEYGVAVLPHVPCYLLQFEDEGYSPTLTEARLLVLDGLVVGVLNFLKGLGHPSEQEVVPSNVVLHCQGQSKGALLGSPGVVGAVAVPRSDAREYVSTQAWWVFCMSIQVSNLARLSFHWLVARR